MNTTIRIIPSLGAVHLDVRRYEAAIAQGWRFEALPDGQCLIVPPGKTPWAGAEVFVARDLAAAVQFLSLENRGAL